ncbi:MAG: GC-type dockerin domain-anchored protein [Planctomycetota bacterium]
MPTRLAAASVVALATAFASAQSTTLTIDTAQSNINVVATAITPVGNETDTAMSGITGTIEVTLDDYGTPTQITLNDFDFALTSDPALSFDFGFLGSANATLVNAVALFATPGTPLGPVPIAMADDFMFEAVPTLLTGTTTFDYNFFLVGADSGTINLADFDPGTAPFSGTISSDGTTVTLEATLNIDALVTVVDGIVDVNLVGTTTLVASGPAPEPTGCNVADLVEPLGIVDLSDVDAFIAAFVIGDAAADIAAPFGVVDLTDVDAFIAAFLAGCP